MEWIAESKPHLHDNTSDLNKFRSNFPEAEGATKSLLIHRSIQKNQTKWTLTDEKSWKDWLEPGQNSQMQISYTTQGFTVLLCAKPKPRLVSDAPPNLNCLTFGRFRLEAVSKLFRTHKHISRIIEKRSTVMSATNPDPILSTVIGPALPVPTDLIYSALFESGSDDYPASIAFTSTYSVQNKAACGIFFGLTDADMDRVEAMLKDCENSWDHPLLLIFLFTELQTRRLRDIINDTIDQAENSYAKFNDLHDKGKDSQPHYLVTLLRDVRNTSALTEEDITAASRQLSKLVTHCELLSSHPHYQNYQHDTNRILNRLREIQNEYEDMIAACRINVAQTILSADLHANEVARKSAKASMVLAFVAMIYLPMTTLATIYAMPALDFRADWKDLYGKPVETSTTIPSAMSTTVQSTSAISSTSPAATTQSSSKSPVVSVYLWYYIAVSFLLSFVTLEAWWVFTSDYGLRDPNDPKNSNQKWYQRPWWRRSLLLTIFHMIWTGLKKLCKL